MTTVNLSGTWSEKTKPNNGLTKVADLIRGDRTIRVPIVGWVEYHQWTEKLTGEVLTVALPVVESCIDADGTDPHGRGKQVFALVDELRKERGLGSADDVPLHSGELNGQIEFEFDDDGRPGGEVRLGPDGEREVPAPSGEEVVAELDERRAAKGKPATDPFTPDGD